MAKVTDNMTALGRKVLGELRQEIQWREIWKFRKAFADKLANPGEVASETGTGALPPDTGWSKVNWQKRLVL